MARRLVAVGLWLGVTGAATAIVWAGTSTVAANLTDRPPPVVAHRDVVIALQPGGGDAATAPGITAPNANTSTSTVPPVRSDPTSAAPGAAVPAPARSPTAPPAVTTTTVRATPTTTQPASPATTKPPATPTATYATAGGVLTVTCDSYFFIRLVSATPSNGYAVNVVNAGPYYVEVHFVRAGRDEPVWAFCLGSPIRAYGGVPVPTPTPGSS
ncbi:MAG: hypothetical protein ACRD12_06660 [Acidimicrobiales bacterium]